MSDSFGSKVLIVNDHWQGDRCAIGLQKDNKLIYVSIYNQDKDQYFYELELLQRVKLDDDMPYIVQGSKNNVSAQRLLEVMSEFFNIKIR